MRAALRIGLCCYWAAFFGLASRLVSAAETSSGGEASEARLAVPLNTREALLFHNGDLLYGRLESILPATGVRWQHSDASQVIEFRPDDIAEIHFPPKPRFGTNSVDACRIQLRNGDELAGKVVHFDSDKVVLQTWYAGEITLPRRVLQAMVPVPPEGAIVFEGPTGREGWTIGKISSNIGDSGEWQYRNGAFYATNAASIARDVKLPDVSNVEFDLAWKGLFQLAIAIYTDYLQPISLGNKESEPDFGGFYSLQLNSFSANLLPIKKSDPIRYLGQVSVPAFNQKNTAHVEIRASKAKRLVALLVDGQLIKQWVDNEEFAGQGTGVRFVHQPQGKVKLSHLRVSEWDGQFEEKPTATPDAKHDIARLRNGDKVSGQLDSLQEGKIIMTTAESKLEIPLNRVKQIELVGTKLDPAVEKLGNVRAFFHRGGAVTFHLEKWEGGRVFGFSPNFGKLVFDPAAFARVELNLKSPTH